MSGSSSRDTSPPGHYPKNADEWEIAISLMKRDGQPCIHAVSAFVSRHGLKRAIQVLLRMDLEGEGFLEDLFQFLFESRQELLGLSFWRDSKANVFQVCLQAQSAALPQLLYRFRELDPAFQDPFRLDFVLPTTGQNAFHILIIQSDLATLRWVLATLPRERTKELVNERAGDRLRTPAHFATRLLPNTPYKDEKEEYQVFERPDVKILVKKLTLLASFGARFDIPDSYNLTALGWAQKFSSPLYEMLLSLHSRIEDQQIPSGALSSSSQ